MRHCRSAATRFRLEGNLDLGVAARSRGANGGGNSVPAPLLSVSRPLACAVWTVCPGSARVSPFGVPWSKRTSTGRNGFGAQALSYEFEHGGDLLARHVELLHDLLDAEVLEVLDDGGDRQARALEHPGAA